MRVGFIQKRVNRFSAQSVMIVAAILVFYALTLWIMRHFVADDAYIVGRYAKNVAAGNGLVFNPGERISALTSPLHALLMVPLAWFSTDPVAVWRMTAPALPLIGWGVMLRIYPLSGARLLILSMFALGFPYVALWSFGGLETSLLLALLGPFAAILARAAQKNHATDIEILGLGLICGLSFLTRFDSLLVTLPPMLAIAVIYPKRRSIWLGAALAFGIAASWLGFAWVYFGDLLPTSARVKLGAYAVNPLDNNAATISFLICSGLLAIAPFLSLSAARAGLSLAIQRGAIVAAVLFFIYAFNTAGQHMMYGFRMFVPVMSAVGLIVVLALRKYFRLIGVFLLAVNVASVAQVHFRGMNPAPALWLPILNAAYAETNRRTPVSGKHFVAASRRDALILREHWILDGKEREPRIFVFTGGLGYWLPEFHVYEVLVSWRRGCNFPYQTIAKTTDYIQIWRKVSTAHELIAFFLQRPDSVDDVEEIDWLASRGNWAGNVPQVGYVFGPDPDQIDQSLSRNGICAE